MSQQDLFFCVCEIVVNHDVKLSRLDPLSVHRSECAIPDESRCVCAVVIKKPGDCVDNFRSTYDLERLHPVVVVSVVKKNDWSPLGIE